MSTRQHGFGPRLAMVSAAAIVAAFCASPASAAGKSLQFVLTDFGFALPNSTSAPGAECPSGMNVSSLDQWRAQFPTEEARQKHLDTYGHWDHRGPNGENVTYQPWLVKDPIPLREVGNGIAFGFNLDGTADGAATDTTCKHTKFTSPEGEKAIDNQLYRVVGCVPGWRTGGFAKEFATTELKMNNQNRVLLEISDVDDEKNDDQVTVTFYKGLDKVVADSENKPLPWLSQRVDNRDPRYTQRTTGKIVDGVLTTAPMKLFRRPILVYTGAGELQIQDMRLTLNLDSARPDGIMGGYHDIQKWWLTTMKSWGSGQELNGFSAPAMWDGITRHADGYKDAATGQCKSISGVYKVQFTPAYIVDKPTEQVAQAPAALAGTGNQIAEYFSKLFR